MAYTPTPTESRRLRRALDLAGFSEGERVFWLGAFAGLAILLLALPLRGGGWIGAVGGLGGLLILYWRLRGGHLIGKVTGDHGLFGLGLATREQRAFTALMFRQVIMGRNPLAPRDEHDPFRRWAEQVERSAAPEEA